MKIFTQNSILKKFVLILIVIITFNAIVPNNISYAANDRDPGGPLLKPIMDFVIFLGDAVMDIIHKVVYDMDISVLKIDKDVGILEFFAIAAGVILAIALIVGACVGMLWIGAALITALGTTTTVASLLTVPTLLAIAGASVRGGAAAGLLGSIL